MPVDFVEAINFSMLNCGEMNFHMYAVPKINANGFNFNRSRHRLFPNQFFMENSSILLRFLYLEIGRVTCDEAIQTFPFCEVCNFHLQSP